MSISSAASSTAWPKVHGATNKRQPPVPLPRRLIAHLRRWVAKGIVSKHFVEWNGRPVKSVKTAFKTALRHGAAKSCTSR